MSNHDFFSDVNYKNIVNNVKGIYMSDGLMSTLLDFERVLDNADLYAFKNWIYGELVDGPRSARYTVSCIFMFPHGLMPDPSGVKRIINIGGRVQYKKTLITVPVKVESPDDYEDNTHYPRSIKRKVWLIRIELPKSVMSDVREGSIDIAGQLINLSDLDDAYAKDLDKEALEGQQKNSDEQEQEQNQQPPNLGL